MTVLFRVGEGNTGCESSRRLYDGPKHISGEVDDLDFLKSAKFRFDYRFGFILVFHVDADRLEA